MPGMVVNRITKRITRMRIGEIADGFVERSSDAFPHWLAEMNNQASWRGPDEFKPTYLPEPNCPDGLF
jgi:hypothetical protein